MSHLFQEQPASVESTDEKEEESLPFQQLDSIVNHGGSDPVEVISKLLRTESDNPARSGILEFDLDKSHFFPDETWDKLRDSKKDSTFKWLKDARQRMT